MYFRFLTGGPSTGSRSLPRVFRSGAMERAAEERLDAERGAISCAVCRRNGLARSRNHLKMINHLGRGDSKSRRDGDRKVIKTNRKPRIAEREHDFKLPHEKEAGVTR